ncbi:MULTISPECIES: hypothetical protein [unclassified Streptomyces]|uniref:hypothetical protein n=1 Tax=unclassified Streptomyces TaxID=2593676 RepID=UPI000F5BC112|nr:MULTISPECIES: hypothetical protein [unclassified Streptomyces]WSX00825.1 hypothetical protein OG355_10505 [Streptomyces sp. NBC_00987]MCX5159493.1 hypothetical protein [Streptomyces sp. NBC_00305]MCX5218016.1 hypothetical protein [Streptomyces sp. NBC_00264]MCX5499810.1 hypothetical protein [Streptomyces sp. NBC_00052]MCX5551654.1 hypothetical protein [Streptomyces sp. NBC_00051]
MGTPVRHFTATTPDGQEFTVNIERDFRYDPYRDFLVCAHCDWSPSLLTMKKIVDMAGEHLASVHGADQGLSQQDNEAFRKAGLIMLPIVAVLLVVLFVCLQNL